MPHRFIPIILPIIHDAGRVSPGQEHVKRVAAEMGGNEAHPGSNFFTL